MCLIKTHFLKRHHYSNQRMCYWSFQFLIIFFSLSHTSHSTRMHYFNSIVITRVQNMGHFHITKSLWLIGQNEEECTVSTGCPMISSASEDGSNLQPSRKTHSDSLKCQSKPALKWALSLLVRFIYSYEHFPDCQQKRRTMGNMHLASTVKQIKHISA